MPRAATTAVTAAVLALAVAACDEKKAARQVSSGTGSATAAADAEPTRPFPTDVTGDGGAIGRAGPLLFIAAADDASWVTVCDPASGTRRPRVVLGEGAGVPVDRILATAAHDLVVNEGGKLVHVDVAGRTLRTIGALAAVAIDDASRRVVHARGKELVVRDPGAAPRTLPSPDGADIGAIELRGKRWAEVGLAGQPNDMAAVQCEHWPRQAWHFEQRATVDLDPSGVEAADRVGPTLGITASGEVTLDGQTVIDAGCAAHVTAALATPPRILAICRNGPSLVVGPDFRQEIRAWLGATQGTDPDISPYLTLGKRLVCLQNACVDLVAGRALEHGNEYVLADDTMLVRRTPGGLEVHRLPDDPLAPPPPARAIALPRVVQAVTIDTATGRRHAGAAPVPPRYLDRAGRWMLYGRYVIDLQDAVLVATLGEDAVAIDHLGRVLVPAAPGMGPFRWKKP